MLMFSHNRECDNKHWFGEVALEAFEDYILVDDIIEPLVFNSYEDFIDHNWSDFVSNSAFE
ncbi:MAG: hypothetical protein IJR35_08395 [Synergistaceae bacterium]|nr:hypothetical protein [Synergistaceae bacterium]MBR0203865.1 hypothetical protein [Synergistaceae bacterium]